MPEDQRSTPPERQAHDDPQVLRGEDDLPERPSRSRDPGTPEPPSPAGDRAFRLLPWAWVVVFVLAGIILYGVFR